MVMAYSTWRGHKCDYRMMDSRVSTVGDTREHLYRMEGRDVLHRMLHMPLP
jgi:C4-type Zn-finger protein